MDEPFDLFLNGTVFLDIVFTGLRDLPARGTEQFVDGMGSCPGGIANLGIAASRLGLHTTLAAAFGDDIYGDFCWSTLEEQEGVDLSYSERFSDWHSPVTVSMVVDRDRAMVTHMHPPPVPQAELLPDLPTAKVGLRASRRRAAGLGRQAATAGHAAVRRHRLGSGRAVVDERALAARRLPRLPAQQRRGDGLHAHRRPARRAARARRPRAGRGRDVRRPGCARHRRDDREEEWVPSLPVNAHDPTGAGDVFGAAFVLGTLKDWPLRQRLAFANLCAALSVQYVGGSLAAPGWGDIVDWLAGMRARAAAGSSTAADYAASYAFIDDVLPTPGGSRCAGPARRSRRSGASKGRRACAAEPLPAIALHLGHRCQRAALPAGHPLMHAETPKSRVSRGKAGRPARFRATVTQQERQPLGQERARKLVAQPPQAGVDHEMRHRQPEEDAEQRSIQRRLPVQVRHPV